MRVFERSGKSGRGNRVTFVDENNVVVGFEFEGSCCEVFGCVFVDKIPDNISYDDNIESIEFKKEDYVFDTTFFNGNLSLKHCDCGACAFRLVNKTGGQIFLILYNRHDVYYAHGFDMKVNDKILYEGNI